jgi:hypothetical protein
LPRNWQDSHIKGQGFSPQVISQLSGIEVDLASALAGIGSAGGMLLSGSHASGASALTLSIAPTALAGGALLAIDPFTTNCELKYVSSVSGTTVNLRASLLNAHSTGTTCLLVPGGDIPASWLGVKGDGSTNDHDALQWALRQVVLADIWLDGQGRTYIISSPICLPQSHRFKNAVVKASAAFAPAESTNAMAMTQDGNIVTVSSADPTTNVITTSTVHGLPGNDIGVVFQGASLPTGLVAGTFYFVTSRPTTTTFTVSLTLGGANVDITSTGTGTAFCEVYAANVKSFLTNVTFECNNVPNLNGILISCQQLATWDQVRVNNAPDGFGVKVKGQEADWRNIEIVRCGVGFQFESMSFLYVKELDMTGCGMQMQVVSSNGLISSTFLGVHVENLLAPGTNFDFTLGCQNVVFDDVSISGLNSDDPLWVGFDMGTAATHICSYDIRRLRFPTASTSTNNLAIRDNYRGKSMLCYTASATDSADREMGQIVANDIPAGAGISDAGVGTQIWGIGGKEIRFGRQQNISPVLELTPGSSQSVDSLIVKDTSATQQFAVTKDGQVKANLGVQKGLATPTYGTTVAVNARSGDWQPITVTDGVAFTISAPTNPPDSSHSQSLTIEIFNNSGGAMGAITWNAAFVMPGGAFTNPASTKKRFVRFEWNGSKWVETSRAGADY